MGPQLALELTLELTLELCDVPGIPRSTNLAQKFNRAEIEMQPVGKVPEKPPDGFFEPSQESIATEECDFGRIQGTAEDACQTTATPERICLLERTPK